MKTNRFHKIWMPAVVILIALVLASNVCLAFKVGPDLEKPKPEFIRSGDRISARYIPQAKSTSVVVDFKAEGGRLVEIGTYDWEEAERPEVNVKNFKSSLFMVHVDGLTQGGEAKVSLISEFFISSTQFFIFNPALSAPWIKDGPVQNISLGNRVQELAITVKDGGPLDADGAADGRITLIGGPRDSFWGYALGTLFIRFFGIFLVLSVLMLGMLFSGRIFQYLEKSKEKSVSQKIEKQAMDVLDDVGDEELDPEMISAIAVGLHLHLSSARDQEYACLVRSEVTPWTQQGRERIMGVRYLALNRMNRKLNS